MPTEFPDSPLAILAIDPGKTTGVAAAYVPQLETLKESLLNAEMKKAVEVRGVDRDAEVPTAEEDWTLHARRLYNIMVAFYGRALIEKSIPMPNIHIVFEDFVLRRRKEGGATGNLTSVWVMAGAISNFVNRSSAGHNAPHIHYQQASLAKGKASNERLKMWGLYERGSEHKRDAWRHLATLADKLL